MGIDQKKKKNRTIQTTNTQQSRHFQYINFHLFYLFTELKFNEMKPVRVWISLLQFHIRFNKLLE